MSLPSESQGGSPERATTEALTVGCFLSRSILKAIAENFSEDQESFGSIA